MQRLLTTAILVGLLVATAAAFAVTERLKLTKSPVYGTKVSQRLSPTCGCARGRAVVRFKLRRPDLLTVRVLDRNKQPVRLLVDARPATRGLQAFRWDGRTDAGVIAHDAAYRVEIHLANQRQTILLPNRISLDTTPPRVKNVRPNREAFSPDGDGQADFVRLQYDLTKPAHILLYLGGQRILRTLSHKAAGSVAWYGHARDRQLGPGSYTLEVGAVDLAGNSTPVTERWRVHVRIRFIELASHRIVAAAGSRFEIGVSTDAKRYVWKLGARKAFAHGPLLRLRAPDLPGRYTLTVSERDYSARAAVIVR